LVRQFHQSPHFSFSAVAFHKQRRTQQLRDIWELMDSSWGETHSTGAHCWPCKRTTLQQRCPFTRPAVCRCITSVLARPSWYWQRF